MFECFHATATTLREIYGRFSEAKRRAYDWCMQDMRDHDGFAPRVIKGNCMAFSFAYQYVNQETGELMLCYHTAWNAYRFSIEGEHVAH